MDLKSMLEELGYVELRMVDLNDPEGTRELIKAIVNWPSDERSEAVTILAEELTEYAIAGGLNMIASQLAHQVHAARNILKLYNSGRANTDRYNEEHLQLMQEHLLRALRCNIMSLKPQNESEREAQLGALDELNKTAAQAGVAL